MSNQKKAKIKKVELSFPYSVKLTNSMRNEYIRKKRMKGITNRYSGTRHNFSFLNHAEHDHLLKYFHELRRSNGGFDARKVFDTVLTVLVVKTV